MFRKLNFLILLRLHTTCLNTTCGEVKSVQSLRYLQTGDAFEVEFSDRDGRTYESLGFHASQLMVLYHEPRQNLDKTINKVQKTTTTPNEKRLCQFKQLYPECLTEGKIDLEKLRNILSTEDIQESKDHPAKA